MQARLIFSHQDDFPSPQALADFVARDARGGLTPRDADMFADAIANGALIAILDASDALIAMAGILPLDEGKFELGGALVRPDMTGFGLQKHMVQARLAVFQARSIAPWTQLYTGAAHANYGAGSRKALTRAGFTGIAYDEGPRELREECQTCTKSVPEGCVCCYQFFRAPSDGLPISYTPGVVSITHARDGRNLELTLPSPD